MAELFLAKDTRNDRMVVLKRILPYLAEEAEFVRMFLDEARIAASLHHPSIVELYELGHLEGSTFIAMEWVDGIDLRRVLQKEQERQSVVPAGVGAFLVARLCEGLHHAHFAKDSSGKPLGIIHRDVSPQNVMVSFRGDVKLVDFGIAKATAWMGRSKPGVIKGKFLYLAPEQLTTEPLDHRTDLFALGTMLYELTTGQSPFYRTSTEAVIYAIRMEEPDPPHKVRKDFPPGLSKIILKCLVKDREDRYQTADEIRRDLEEFLRTDLPTTFLDVQAYVSRLFGDDSERTSIFIPPNAQSKNDREKPPIDRVESRTDTSTQRGNNPFADEEATQAIPGASALGRSDRPGPPVPEGRRETGEQQRAEITAPTKSDRPRVRSSIGPAIARPAPAATSPWEPEVTAPMPREEVTKRRDFQMTAELSGARLLDDDVPATAVSTSGARDLEVGEVFKPLVPTLAGLDSVPDLPPSRSAPPIKTPPRNPPPGMLRDRIISAPPTPEPMPSFQSLPEVSVVSAGDATQGSLMEVSGEASEVSEPSQPSQPSEPSEPTPPAPSTRAPPRRGPPTGIKRPAPIDPDDEVATVDQANEFSVTTRSSSQKVMIALFGVAALVVLVLLIVLLWPSGDDSAVKKPTPPKPAKVETAAPAAPEAPSKVRVVVRAVKGTVMTVDGKSVAPGDVLERAVGEMVLKFSCPGKKKAKEMTTLRAKVPVSEAPVAVEVPCK